MAVASDDWPRFSLLTGGYNSYARPETPQIESELLQHLAGGFSIECWLQIRPRKGATQTQDASEIHGCWLLHTPLWAFGLTVVGSVVVHYDGKWLSASPDSMRRLDVRRWHHIAVTRATAVGELEAFVNGEPLALVEGSVDLRGLSLPVSPVLGLRIGWSSTADSHCQLALHEFRVWSIRLPVETIHKWRELSISREHPYDAQLVAHWSLSSGSALPKEIDLSGHDLHLTVEAVAWLRMTPLHFHAMTTEDPARLVTWQDAQNDSNNTRQQCRFVVEIYIQPPPDTASLQKIPLGGMSSATLVVLVLNFQCFRSPSLMVTGKGTGIIISLQQFIRKLPDECRLAIFDATTGEAILAPSAMSEDTKVHAARALDRVVIKTLRPLAELVESTIHCIDAAFRMQTNSTERCVISAIVANEDARGDASEAAQAMEIAVEQLQTCHRTVEVHTLHVTQLRVDDDPQVLKNQSSCSSTSYVRCDRDLEWVLAFLLQRQQTLVVAMGELDIQALGGAVFRLNNESQPQFQRFAGPHTITKLTIPIGACAYGERLVLAGVAEPSNGADPASTEALVALTFSYYCSDGRRRVAYVCIRFERDLTNHVHVERAERNKRLRITDDDAMLLEQRRQLMKKKSAFVTSLVNQEVAEAENMFKKINIMKEELWAKRKWIVERGLRIFEETELESLSKEADHARAQFAERMEGLQGRFVSHSRELSSRGASRGGNRQEASALRIRLGPNQSHRHENEGEDEEEDSEAQQLHKTNVKLSVQTKALDEHLGKMEDLFTTVRLAESKGPVIMNDTRRTWIVRYQDMIRVKREVLNLTRAKEQIEQRIEYLAERVGPRQEVDAEVQATNASIARFDKELIKRRKRAALCMKEIVGSVVDEFEASQQVDAALRDLAKSRLLATLALREDMFQSCVYMCFPVELSSGEVMMKTLSPAFANLVHAVCCGLRRFCDTSSESPVCRRLSFGESFVWWGVEQLASIADPSTLRSSLDMRRGVQVRSWAVIVFSYNALFSSPLAMADVKETLTSAIDQKKPVLHVELERPLQGLEEFKQHWRSRRVDHNAKSLPVEREFMMWRQNFALFETLLRSVERMEQVRLRGAPFGGCEHNSSAVAGETVSPYPCLACVWPRTHSSYVSKSDPPEQEMGEIACDSETSSWFIDFVCFIGSWIDDAQSASLQTAPRSYHVDPTAISPLSRAWLEEQQHRVAVATSKWAEARLRRTKEIQRQVDKLFKVYEEESFDLVALKFKFYKRRAEVLSRMQAQLGIFVDERKLLETWLQKLTHESTSTEHGRVGHEMETMTSQELWQHLHYAEQLTLSLEELDERTEAPPEHELMAAKQQLEAALRQSSRAILDIGRAHIEDTFRSMMRDLKRGEYMDQIKLATEKCEHYQAQVARMTEVFDQAETIVADMLRTREAFIGEDASAFFASSCIEIQAAPSVTTQGSDLAQLRSLASDMDFHSSLSARVMSQALEAQLAASTAHAYRVRVQEATATFLSVYTPSLTVMGATTGKAAGLKDFCMYSADEPVASWHSLQAMHEYVDQEALCDRERLRLLFQWKLRFTNTLLGLHFTRWWTTCRAQLLHTRQKLSNVSSAKEEIFSKRCASERAFRVAVADRESYNHQLALLQRRLVETRQRQQFLLKLLHVARGCYEKAARVMSEKLQNVKTDVIYKSWAAVSDYHVAVVGELFDWRAHCAQDLDKLAEQVNECQQSLTASDEVVQAKRLEWLKQSIADHLICAEAERHEELAHRRLDLILSLERERVFGQFRVLDPRSVWLTTATLTSWYDEYHSEQSKAAAARAGRGVPSQSGVDDALVQLSIARLDVIKQAKWRDALQRKLAVFEQILHQQTEMHQIIDQEVCTYRSMGDRLTRRVVFLREMMESSGRSEYLKAETIDVSRQVSSFDKTAAVQATRASREQLQDLVFSAQQDFLAAEATTCQFSWRMQQHIASEYRAQQVIEDTKRQLRAVETYLEVLQTKDRELYVQGLRPEAMQAPDHADENNPTQRSSHETTAMGLEVTTGLAVFEFYSRDQWFRSCLDRTTALGERIKSLRELLSSLLAIKRPPSRPEDAGDPGKEQEAAKATLSSDEEDRGEEQLVILERELRMAELALLLNRFESRTAEKTSEAVKDTLTNDLMNRAKWSENRERCTDADVDCVIPTHLFEARLFSVDLCVTKRGVLLAQLRDFATTFDPRDVAGNLSEVIYGASLDVNNLKDIFLLQSKAHVEEQWNIVFIALFFARLFRRASLRKVATLRRGRASQLTQERVLSLHYRQYLATQILELGNPQGVIRSLEIPQPEEFQSWIHALIESVRIEVEESGDREQLGRIALAVLKNQPLHRVVSAMASEAAATITQAADEFAETRAIAERRPPKPTALHVFLADRYTIKIQWKPLAMDHDLVYVAEISEHEPHGSRHSSTRHPTARRYWHPAQTLEKSCHTFYNLIPGHSYWIRVRSGFTKIKLGDPCSPILVTTLP